MAVACVRQAARRARGGVGSVAVLALRASDRDGVPIVDGLERERFVRSRWESDNGRPGPRRRFYSLTDEGRTWARVKLDKSNVSGGRRIDEV